jgi:hypothetical protein
MRSKQHGAGSGKLIAGIAIVAVIVGAAIFGWQRLSGPNLSLAEPLVTVERYCTDCHNEAEFAGGVSFESLSANGAHEDAAVWERMVRKMRAGAMPPIDVDARPDDDEVAQFVQVVETTLDTAFASNPQPPAPLIHRLNRTEYTNAVRDLFDISIDASQYLPPDNVVEGFDNIAEALSISPALLEGYLSASARVASLAVGDPHRRPEATTYRAKADETQDEYVPGAPLGTIGGIVFEHYFPVDGTYRFQPRLYRQILASIRGLQFEHTLEVTIDKILVHSADFGGYDDNKRSNEENAFAVAEEIDARLSFETDVTAGPHTVAVNFRRRPPNQSADLWKQYQRQLFDSNEDKGDPHLDQVDITGPLKVAGLGDTPSRRRIFSCMPQSEEDEPFCATEILSRLARQAYRRPVSEAEITELMSFYELGRANGTFDKGIETALRRMISGAEFLFRAEVDPEGVAPGETYQITDLELASRLSFFLWSSLPDEELIELASRSALSDPATLRAQVDRMLQDPRSNAFIENFAGQWLALRNLEGIVPDPGVFPDFDNNLRVSLVRETELLFDSIVREDRSILDIIDADYTFLNQRLAEHYGIDGIYGPQFRRVAIDNPERRGILSHGSFLTMTSVATRTSPVTRGKWILDNMLGLPPPAPPPNVPAIEASATGQPQTLRDQMTRHRADPVCSACHKVMDPLGFALENFDAVGRWRVEDGGKAIDVVDTFYDGSRVDGVSGLRAFLLDNRYLFTQTLTEKLMTYALGRSIEAADMPVVRQILRDAAANEYRFSTIIWGIVESPAFQMRTAAFEPDGPVVAQAELD